MGSFETLSHLEMVFLRLDLEGHCIGLHLGTYCFGSITVICLQCVNPSLICVLVARPRRCPTLSNPVPTKLTRSVSDIRRWNLNVVVTLTLQPEDDHERIQEAVARTLAVGLMSNDFSVHLDAWLNPTEVRRRIIYIIHRCILYIYDDQFCQFLLFQPIPTVNELLLFLGVWQSSNSNVVEISQFSHIRIRRMYRDTFWSNSNLVLHQETVDSFECLVGLQKNTKW